MTNIWVFFNQTLSVSLLAVILLLVKQLMNDKLSPRWQYGICSLLALRLLIPVQTGKGIFMTLQIWLEVLKATVEKGLDSVYTQIYEPAAVNSIFPRIDLAPNSITDWLFVGYVAGVIIMLLKYLLSYLRLRSLLKRGMSGEGQEFVEMVAEKYQLKSCRAALVEGLSSAFVCCGVQPILALPAGKQVDEKVILHELLHLKYHDELQSVVWCILRSFHWCNPFLQYVFRRIENDMEALCDQRVLERLEGEERREYGKILLEMANEKYARTPGTSSISNGGKNIARRIEAIVRFKKYPKGMALVSVCIGIVIFVPGLMEQVNADGSYVYRESDYQPQNEQELNKAMALARLNRCTTLAGALDAYAKGCLFHQGIYIATVTPVSEHGTLVQRMETYDSAHGLYYMDPGAEFEAVTKEGYRVFNLEKIDKDCYRAYLAFESYNQQDYTENSVLIPVEVFYEDAWMVRECGPRILSSVSLDQLEFGDSEMPAFTTYQATGETGTVTVTVTNYWEVDNAFRGDDTRWTMGEINRSLKVDAQFQRGFLQENLQYEYTPKTDGLAPENTIGVKYIALENVDERVEFPEDFILEVGVSGGNSDGFSWGNHILTNIEEGVLKLGGGTFLEGDDYAKALPEAFQVQIYWDNTFMEELILQR